MIRRPAMRCLLPALLLALLPAAAVTGDGTRWHGTRVGDVDYLPLEDIRSFYKLLPVDRGRNVRSVGNGDLSLVFGPDARTLGINGISCTLSYPTQTDGKGDLLVSKADMVKLIDPVLRPTYIPDRRPIRTVVVDAGHGGHDPGTVCGTVREADIVLQVAQALKKELEKRGFTAVLTQTGNRYLSDQQRIDAANMAQDALFISLHLNSGRSDYSGVQTYTLAPAVPGGRELPANGNDAANAALAMALQASLVRRCGAADGGCRHARYSMLSSVKCPAAMVELGYATNKAEGAALCTEEYRSRLARALAEGVDTFARLMDPETVLKESAGTPGKSPAAAARPAEPVDIKPVEPAAPARRAAGTSTTATRRPAQGGTTRRGTAAQNRTTTPARQNTPAKPATPARSTRTAPATPGSAQPLRRTTPTNPVKPSRNAPIAQPRTPAAPAKPATPTRQATPAKPNTPAKGTTTTKPAKPTPKKPARR